ncbi:MAG TPA: hypothetical protein VHW74_04040, partial [Mycobacteriales bacterium]|nr:hypothetical protein [Mycobacteriales bacterium]
GAAIAPTEATIFAMVDHAAPAGTMTEAFAWLATAMAVGGAIGAASAGIVADRAGPAAAFGLAGGAGALAVLTIVLRSRTITGPGHLPESAAPDTDPQHGHRASMPRPATDVPQPAFAEVGGP